jgi:fructokinase
LRPEATRGRGKRVVLFGEALVDEASTGTTPGGAPFNVACHLSRLGFSALLLTRVGADDAGREIVNAARACGLPRAGIQVDPRRHTARVRVRHAAGGPTFGIPARQAFDEIDAPAACATFTRFRPGLLYFGTLAQRSATSRSALAALLRPAAVSTFLDVNLRPPWWSEETLVRSLEAATTVKANEKELMILAEALRFRRAGTRGRAEALLSAFPCSRLVVTRGASGAVLFSRRGQSVRARVAPGRALPGPARDSVGAGDAFSAAFLVGLLLGWPAAQTLDRANQLGAALCTVRGARPESAAFYAPFRRRWRLG